jgi:hypothetical protein
VYCWACGTKLPKAASFCPGCGIRVDDDPDDVEESYDVPGWEPLAARPHEAWAPAPVPEVIREQPRGFGLRREGPIGKLVSFLSLPAGIVAIYLAVRFWGENRELSVRVLIALALTALSPLLAGLVFVPLGLLLGLLLRRASDRTRGSVASFGRSVFEGTSNVLSLAAIAYIALVLWATFQ